MGPAAALLLPKLADAAIEVGRTLIDRIFPDKEKQARERAEAERELLLLTQKERMQDKADQLAVDLAQIEVNKIEAASDSFWKSGWRPTVGWMCVSGTGYQVLFRPIIGWIMMNIFGWDYPPELELETLMTLLFALLGLGGYRTFERVKGKI